MSEAEVIQYETQGTCCRMMQVAIQDGKVMDAVFRGGCNGNLKGISSLVKGRKIDDVINDLKGIESGILAATGNRWTIKAVRGNAGTCKHSRRGTLRIRSAEWTFSRFFSVHLVSGCVHSS